MQNKIPTTTHKLKLKPEVEFHDGRSFSETGSSFISADTPFTGYPVTATIIYMQCTVHNYYR